VGVAVATTDSDSDELSKGETMVMPRAVGAYLVYRIDLSDEIGGNGAAPLLVNDWTVPNMVR